MSNLIENRLFHIALLLFLTALCYIPGLNSLFLFDDAPNLAALAQIKDLSITSAGFWEFVMSGEAGPTGRPVSLLSFALQAASWPDNPPAFKLVNLLIHTLSSLLVYDLCFRLSVHMQATHRHACLVALGTALIWALHPVHTSTVLYTVQRMALLSNCFMLAGIYSFTCFRLGHSSPDRKHLAWITLALGVTGLLALLSKENAPSLVFYLLILDYTLLNDLGTSPSYRRWRQVCLWLPALLLVVLSLFYIDQLQSGFEATRAFTMGERLLTQTRILWTYLAAIIMPSVASVGIFHDTAISTSLLTPFTTLLAIIAWIALAGLLVARPGRHGAWLFALGWFWSGHLVESTLLPLELFFHHRNYLAFLGIVFVLLFAFFHWLPETLVKFRGKLAITGFYLFLLILISFRISSLWSEPVRLAEKWYEADPTTARNAEFYAMQLARYGAEGEMLAAAVLAQAVSDIPDNFHLQLNLTTLACLNPAIMPPAENSLINGAEQLSLQSGDPVSPVRQIVSLYLQGNCDAYSATALENLLLSLIENTEGYDRGMFQFELARLKLFQGNTDEALSLLSQAWENSRDSGILFNQAIELVNASRLAQALQTIDLAIQEVTANNDINTGTRASKLASLSSMREDVLGFMASE